MGWDDHKAISRQVRPISAPPLPSPSHAYPALALHTGGTSAQAAWCSIRSSRCRDQCSCTAAMLGTLWHEQTAASADNIPAYITVE